VNAGLKKIKHIGDKQQGAFYVLVVPFALLFFVFTVVPVIASIVLSFFSYDIVNLPKWAGIGNYIRIFFADDVFGKVLSNTLVYAFVIGPVGYIACFLLAWMVNEFSPTGRTALSFLFYAPALMGNAFFIWQVLFSGDSYGYINNTLLSWGMITEPVQWLRKPEYAMPIVVVVSVWASMGVTFLSNIAGLQNVNTELYEAGAVDGIRNRWYELWYITIPSMKSIMMFGVVMQIQAAFSVSLVPATLAGYPSVNRSTDTILQYLGDMGTVRYEMGYAAALSVLLFGLMILFRYLMNKIIHLTGR
jgi:multiple sugar transport system permease protein